MTTLTHIAVGAVIAKAVLSGHKIQADPTIVYAVSILFSHLPDFTQPLIFLRYRVRKSHHLYSMYHKPIFWVGLYVLLQLTLPHALWNTIAVYANIALIAVGVHFLLDSFGPFRGVVWFSPILKKELYFVKLQEEPTSGREFIKAYTKTVVHKVQILIIAGCLLYLLKKPV